MDSKGIPPSEGGVEVAGVLKAHGELREEGAGMHVRFACNVTLAPLYPQSCPSSAQNCTTHSTLPVGRTTPDPLGRLSHLLTERRLEGGLPPESVTPASSRAWGSALKHTTLKKRGQSLYSNAPTCGTLEAADMSLQFDNGDRAMPGPLAVRTTEVRA